MPRTYITSSTGSPTLLVVTSINTREMQALWGEHNESAGACHKNYNTKARAYLASYPGLIIEIRAWYPLFARARPQHL